MRITQGTFSFLPDLSDEQITRQIAYCLDNGWSVSIEHTDDPHPRNTYWEMWGSPMFDLKDPAGVMAQLEACRAAFAGHYIRVGGLDASLGFESLRLSFIVNRPPEEPGFRLERSEGSGRTLGFTTHAYATDKPPGDRY